MDETKVYDSAVFRSARIDEELNKVLNILKEKGYDPINQVVGYLMSGDPGYISNYKDARKKILKYNRSEILEFLLKEYMDK